MTNLSYSQCSLWWPHLRLTLPTAPARPLPTSGQHLRQYLLISAQSHLETPRWRQVPGSTSTLLLRSPHCPLSHLSTSSSPLLWRTSLQNYHHDHWPPGSYFSQLPHSLPILFCSTPFDPGCPWMFSKSRWGRKCCSWKNSIFRWSSSKFEGSLQKTIVI